jgi:hypothetical protein
MYIFKTLASSAFVLDKILRQISRPTFITHQQGYLGRTANNAIRLMSPRPPGTHPLHPRTREQGQNQSYSRLVFRLCKNLAWTSQPRWKIDVYLRNQIGRILGFWRLFTLSSLLKIIEVAQILGRFFHA